MLKNIQALRAIAALLVVMHHLQNSYRDMGGTQWLIEKIGYFGNAGVDIFFVISGFVIALTISNSEQGLSPALDYMKKRLFRIYLGYWPALLLMMAVCYFVFKQSFDQFNLTNSFLLLQTNYLSGKKSVLDVSWTLTFELYFYTLCAAAFFITRKKFNMILFIYFCCIVGINIKITTGEDIFFVLRGNDTPSVLFGFFTSFFILEFIAGWFLYHYRHLISHRMSPILLLIGLVVFATTGIHLDARGQFVRAYTFGLASVFLVALAHLLESKAIYVAKEWLVSLGDASYTIYLYHLILLSTLAYWGFWQRYSEAQNNMPNLAILIFLGLLCSLCVLLYDNIEKNVYRFACQKISFAKRRI